MTSSETPLSISDDINVNIKALWPDRDIELDYQTDDYETYYVDLLELCGDVHSGLYFRPVFCDTCGGSSYEKATEKLHRAIKESLRKKLAERKSGSEGDKGKQ